jgi:hypothetical protein
MEITIKEVVEMYCEKRCKMSSNKCSPGVHCEDKKALEEVLQGWIITKKTNRERADELFLEGINRNGSSALNCFKQACELYREGDE